MKLDCEVMSCRLGRPFVSCRGALTQIDQILVRLHWEGWTGLGTAPLSIAPGKFAGSEQASLASLAKHLEGVSPFHLEQVLERLAAKAPGESAVLAAVDMALHDLLGLVAGLPLRHLWGLAGLSLGPTSLSLGLLPEAELIERVRQLAAWPILKLKMSATSDVHIVGRLREVYDGRIWIDGNGTWDAAQAIAAAETFHRHGVELLEQPIRAGTPELLGFVRERSPVPIVADEDCVGIQDVLRLQGHVDAINIKLLKCGGLRRALEMIHLARHAGLAIMLGCKTESVLGITAIAQLGGLADYLDLDGHIDLLDDPYAGINIICGRVHLPPGPGIGIAARQDSNPTAKHAAPLEGITYSGCKL